MPFLLRQSQDEIVTWLAEHGQPTYRAAQIQKWLYEKRADSFETMSDLPKALRAELAADFDFWSTQIDRHLKSNDGTEKLLIKLADGHRIECVLLRDGIRRTICVSTQVGCAMGCVFCASGLDGVVRNLETGEIIEQMLRLERLLPPDERLSHIVVMGMGEPLANLKNLLPALKIASDSEGFGISARRITISTVGLPSAILELARWQPRYHLAVSLHAANDSLRNELVPISKKFSLSEILRAADHYFEQSSRRLTFEYVLLADLNDHPTNARQLAVLLKGRPAMINLIPYNPVAGLPYKMPSREAVTRFRTILQQAGLNVQVREQKGEKIDAACGQLRRTVENPSDPNFPILTK